MSREYGRYPQDTKVKQWWGARAIFNPNDKYRKLEILRDRQDYEGDKDSSDAFISWVNTCFLKRLEKHYGALYADQSRIVILESDDGRYIGEACCQNSSGYLYIGCWEVV